MLGGLDVVYLVTLQLIWQEAPQKATAPPRGIESHGSAAFRTFFQK